MAARFWVGGTGTWDAADTAHWSATSGGAGGQSVPGSADTVTFDASSGGGTVTVATNVTVLTITMGAFTGTLDFATNDNSVTLDGASANFNNSGTGTRTLNMGDGTWTINKNGSGTAWTQATTTNLTFNANSSTLVFNGTFTGTRTVSLGATGGSVGGYNVITFGANTSRGATALQATTAVTIATLNASSSIYFVLTNGVTYSITNTMTISGNSLSSLVAWATSSPTSIATISSANNGTFTWNVFRDITFAGGGTFSATNSLDFGNNTNISIAVPTVGGGARVIGG
jgi:hypothetical protein